MFGNMFNDAFSVEFSKYSLDMIKSHLSTQNQVSLDSVSKEALLTNIENLINGGTYRLPKSFMDVSLQIDNFKNNELSNAFINNVDTSFVSKYVLGFVHTFFKFESDSLLTSCVSTTDIPDASNDNITSEHLFEFKDETGRCLLSIKATSIMELINDKIYNSILSLNTTFHVNKKIRFLSAGLSLDSASNVNEAEIKLVSDAEKVAPFVENSLLKNLSGLHGVDVKLAFSNSVKAPRNILRNLSDELETIEMDMYLEWLRENVKMTTTAKLRHILLYLSKVKLHKKCFTMDELNPKIKEIICEGGKDVSYPLIYAFYDILTTFDFDFFQKVLLPNDIKTQNVLRRIHILNINHLSRFVNENGDKYAIRLPLLLLSQKQFYILGKLPIPQLNFTGGIDNPLDKQFMQNAFTISVHAKIWSLANLFLEKDVDFSSFHLPEFISKTPWMEMLINEGQFDTLVNVLSKNDALYSVYAPLLVLYFAHKNDWGKVQKIISESKVLNPDFNFLSTNYPDLKNFSGPCTFIHLVVHALMTSSSFTHTEQLLNILNTWTDKNSIEAKNLYVPFSKEHNYSQFSVMSVLLSLSLDGKKSILELRDTIIQKWIPLYIEHLERSKQVINAKMVFGEMHPDELNWLVYFLVKSQKSPILKKLYLTGLLRPSIYWFYEGGHKYHFPSSMQMSPCFRVSQLSIQLLENILHVLDSLREVDLIFDVLTMSDSQLSKWLSLGNEKACLNYLYGKNNLIPFSQSHQFDEKERLSNSPLTLLNSIPEEDSGANLNMDAFAPLGFEVEVVRFSQPFFVGANFQPELKKLDVDEIDRQLQSLQMSSAPKMGI